MLRRSARRLVCLLPLAAAGLAAPSCSGGGGGEGGGPELTVVGREALATPLGDFVRYMGDDRVGFETAGDPAAAAEEGTGLHIAVVADLDCVECYRLEIGPPGVLVVHGDAPLGVQYGLARLLEQMGYGFFHPWRTRRPETLRAPDSAELPTDTVEPEMALRGLRPHTLHPIESYFDFWEPGGDNLEGARRTVDWIVKNRGNFVGWVGLNDVQTRDSAREAWRPHTRAIVDYAHARGIEAGIDVQLFSSGNLQLAFDLVDPDSDAPIEEQVREGMAPLEGLPFDQIQMSFGEFFAEEPDAFVDATDRARTTIGEVMPDVTVTGSIHVSGDLRVTWEGEEIPYYHLVTRTETELVPWVHTVMYYNLFEKTGGAYDLEDFSEHRELLLDRLRAGEPTVYFPETAYWVAFDNSIPTYLPLYVRSRWLDLARIREEAEAGGFDDLDGHVIFSSGWEWGYWQNDWAALRMSYRLPDSWEQLYERMLAPFGEPGAALAARLVELAEAQQTALVEQELAAYYAGRDSTIDIGDEMGIHSQPDRPSFAELAAMDEAALAGFETDVVQRLGTFAERTAAVQEAVDDIEGLPTDDPWIAEIRDGIAIDVHRARFAHAVWRAAVANARGEDPSALVDEAQAEMEAGLEVAQRRHANMHDPDPDALVARRRRNATLYDYGYLREANTLCFWERELAQLRNEALGADERVPPCVL